jgi:hypothetical protein
MFSRSVFYFLTFKFCFQHFRSFCVGRFWGEPGRVVGLGLNVGCPPSTRAEKSPDWEGSERKCGLPDSQIWDGFGRGDRHRYFQSPFPPPPPPPPRRTIRPSSASPSLCMVLRKGASSPSLFFCVSYEFFRKDAWNLGICSDFGAGSHTWAVSKTRP